MTRARLLALTGALLGAIVCVFACGSSREAFDAPGRFEPDDSGAGAPPTDGGGPISRGVVLVHAAAFPSFRLCFENYPELRPQPDSKIMPNANVVGVEVGSVIRIEPLARAPGRIFVIDRGQVEAAPGKDEPTCGSLICADDGGSGREGCLRPGLDYDTIAAIHGPIGTDRVELLAIAGCANGLVLDGLGVDPAACGEDWQLKTGNLTARIVELSPRAASPELGLPVQVVHLAPMLDPSRANGGRLEISFGSLSERGAPLHTVAMDPPLFASADPTLLQVARDESSFYGSHGFRIALTSGVNGDAGGADDAGSDAGTAIVVDQSLAEIQDLSAPRDVPASYYRAASNYALLLLGDPAISKTIEGGKPNPAYNPRRGVHLLALPVLDPNDLDAGTDSGDGSVDSGSTGGSR